METKNVEVVQLKKGDKGASDKGGKLETTQKEEVGGRMTYQKAGQCPVCGFIGQFTYDTNAYHWYTCANCGAILRA